METQIRMMFNFQSQSRPIMQSVLLCKVPSCLTMQVAGALNVDFALSAIASITVECTIILERDITIWVEDSDGNPPGPPSDITDFLCLNGCSGHGDCVAGTCSINLMLGTGSN